MVGVTKTLRWRQRGMSEASPLSHESIANCVAPALASAARKQSPAKCFSRLPASRRSGPVFGCLRHGQRGRLHGATSVYISAWGDQRTGFRCFAKLRHSRCPQRTVSGLVWPVAAPQPREAAAPEPQGSTPLGRHCKAQDRTSRLGQPDSARPCTPAYFNQNRFDLSHFALPPQEVFTPPPRCSQSDIQRFGLSLHIGLLDSRCFDQHGVGVRSSFKVGCWAFVVPGGEVPSCGSHGFSMEVEERGQGLFLVRWPRCRNLILSHSEGEPRSRVGL